ncbi:MAG: hypothetical protein RMN52_01555 [Anaerolineae bacterium]|nr:hypothetical protein [Candidatus Roseilinea sp.]MDW8448665.1 hypothetical protein [Anaerolineae bacterium]
MSAASPILLLDVDGTLIEDRGYRCAQVEAARFVCRRWGLPDHTPTEDEINVLHACGFSNEWDSTAFNVGINLVESQRGNGARPDFAAWATKTRAFAGLPHERARALLLSEAPSALHPSIHRLLDDVRDPRVSETTRLLYTFVLGSARFEQHFGLKAEVETPSFLETMDAPIPNARSRQIILSRPASAYTARPTLPPDSSRPGLYQTPEGEIALAQLGMTELPLMGLGPMQWLADVKGGSIWDYAKPALVQPIAAMLAAVGCPLRDAALAAHAFVVQRDRSGVERLDGRQVIVFEDNAGGVRAVRDAAAALRSAGVHVQVFGFGVARDPAKRAALAEVCDRLFDDVNAALAVL